MGIDTTDDRFEPREAYDPIADTTTEKLEQARVTFERSAKSNRSKITESMKLNHKLPKAHTTDRCPRAGLSCNVLKSLVTLALLVSINRAEGRHQQIQESSSSNEISHQPSLTNYSHLTRNVTDLRLISDLRSIQLRWNYVQPNTISHIKPAVFEIRYCELTSWMAEIKCRHRNVPVVGSADDDEAAGSLKHVNHHHPHHHHHATNNAIPNSVISQVDQQQEQQLDAVVRPVSSEPVVVPAAETTGPKSAIAMISSAFETNIYDLRALTNYTFDVHVARFTGEPQLSTYPATSGGHGDGSVKLNSAATSGGTRLQQRPGRRLDVGGAHNAGPNELLPSVAGWPDKQQPYRVETKPFQAEALKCLANSSEVLINTGRYFGGRISVESQPFDSRCQLVGNKSSSQTSYLLRIDHELCRSKVIDSNRIETMILVHENKDILTHNTARFLVQCNIMQKSFTVKASVSLPKILNHQQQQQTRPGAASFRPATITMLSGRPVGAASQQAETNPVNQARLPPQPMQEQQVRLGSMPGVYRSIRAGGSSNSGSSDHADTEPARWSLNSTDEHRPIATTAEAESQLSPRIALPAPASDGDSVGGGARSANSSGRRSKELLAHESRFRDTIQLATGDNYRLELPKPVEVSSKVLFVARAANNDNSLVAPLPVARQRGARNGLGHWDRMTAPAGSLANGSVALTVESDGEGSVGQPARLLAATGDGSSHNHHNHNHKSPQKQQSPMATDERSRSSPVTVGNEHHTANGDDGDDSKVSLADQLMTQPIIMRNNHRVAGGFPSLARMITAANQQSSPVLTSTSAKQTDPAADFSIRYSTTKVDEYSLDADSPTPTANKTGQELQPLVVQPVQARSRSGRMRQIVSTAPSTVSLPSIDHKQQQQHALGRMGDAMPQQQDLIGAESAPQNEFSLWPQARDNDSPTNDATATKSIMTADSQPIANTTTTTVNPTLAQNITGALIRWSLKTLGNLARKSLESLVDERDLVATGSGNQSSDLEWNKVQRHGERLRDGFLLVDDGRESSGGHKESAAATIITAPPRQTPRIQPSTTTSSNGLLQQHVRTATQSADLVQSRAPHHLEPPPLLRAGGSSSSRQATTVALATVPSDSVTTPSSIRTTSTTTTTTTRAPTVQAQRQHKSHSSNNNQQQQQPHSEQQQQQHHSARIRTHHGDESTNSLQLLRAIDSQAKESGTPSGGGSSSYWPIYVLWGLIGSVALLMLVIYFVAFASSTSPQMFKPSSARHYNEATAGNSRRSQPRLGFLAQLNDAIYRNHHHHSSSWPDGPAGMRQNTAKGLQQQQQHSVDTIDHLLDNSEVRSPNAQRRRNNQNLQSQSQNHNHNKHSNNHSTPKDTGALIGSGPSLASPCDFGSATSTRSTSAASTANLSATLAASSLDLADHQQDRQQDENYCKNHEQFVYSDYLLLNKSDCLANECGRNESFA